MIYCLKKKPLSKDRSCQLTGIVAHGVSKLCTLFIENISLNVGTVWFMAYARNFAENSSFRKYLLISKIILKFLLQSLQPWFYLGVKYFYYRAKIFFCTYVNTWRDFIYSKLRKSFLTSCNIERVIYPSHSHWRTQLYVYSGTFWEDWSSFCFSDQIKVKSVEEQKCMFYKMQWV